MSADDLEFLTAGCVDVVTPESLKQKLARGTPLTVKVGFDPTAPDIHLGHTVLMRKMKHFQDRGHRVVFVIGDFTGMIGDPTGKSKTRPPLSREAIERNAETYKAQAFKILDPARTEVRFNREWLGALGSDGLIRLAATYNVARMLERRDFRQRFDLGQPISVHEFLYPLAQAYDSVALKADVELGGTDQLFNLNVGRDIMPAYGLEPQVVMTTPLLEGTDGVEKMSKSLDNYIGVTDSPDVMFGKVLSISDELMWKYYLHLTDVTPSALERDKQRGEPMQSKVALAKHLVTDFHDAAAADRAEAEWRRIHQSRELPSDMPVFEVAPGPRRINQLLVEVKLAPSNSEATRLVKQRAVRVDGLVVDTPSQEVEIDDRRVVIAVGPKRFVQVTAQGVDKRGPVR
jgi:tyrosyl-tRNA synthetase